MTYARTRSSGRKPFSHGRTSTDNTKRRFPKRSGGAPSAHPFKRRSHASASSSRGRGKFERIDVSRFISKATIVEKEEIYVPTHTFSDFAILPRLKSAIARRQYIYPSPIQDRSIPHALAGRDILGIANTGTGKTAAFLIPLIDKVLKNPKEQALIMAPTRELAIQIEKELFEFTRGMHLYSAVCVGGAPITPQIRALRRGVSFIIGTPGRLMDLLDRNEYDLSKVHSVVLDEADRMLDMGFIKDITKMLEMMPETRQNLFFSATLPKEIEKLVQRFTNDPVHIAVKTRDTAKNVDQDVVRVAAGAQKIDVLDELLKQPEFKKVLIFAEMKHVVEKLSNDLQRRGFKAGAIHGNKRHNDRQRTLLKFRTGEISILVATDVAARGLDIPNVSHVINYEIPQTYDTYVHRIGRTGRASAKGAALTFV